MQNRALKSDVKMRLKILCGATTISMTTLSIMTPSIKGLYVTLVISDIHLSNALPLCRVSLC
jgi:hypothetical protein